MDLGMSDVAKISIHAPRMGSDGYLHPTALPEPPISIHAPRMGSDTSPPRCSECPANFNPRSPDGERRTVESSLRWDAVISIHAPRMGSDNLAQHVACVGFHFNPRSPDGERPKPSWRASPRDLFQSTLPGWGATLDTMDLYTNNQISIHAPRMGSDHAFCAPCAAFWKFQSTLPGWGATNCNVVNPSRYVFQSTLPGWGATVRLQRRFEIIHISIHAPRMGSDPCPATIRPLGSRFQSTLPGWGATAKMDIFAHDMGKIIHFQH